MESIKSEIRQLIGNLNSRFDNLPDGPLHPLDADLMLTIIRQIYEKTEALRNLHLDKTVVLTKPEQVSQSSVEMPEPASSKQVEIPLVIPEEILPVQLPIQPASPPEVFHTNQSGFVNPPASETNPQIVNEFMAESEFRRDSGPAKTKPLPGPIDLFGTPTIADKLKTDAPSLNERITTGRSDQTLADRIHLKPIGDLKAAIGLNDKFQFINELFEGSAERYTEAINLLNSCSGSNDAEALFKDLKSRYSWDENNPASIKIHEFVVRRYL